MIPIWEGPREYDYFLQERGEGLLLTTAVLFTPAHSWFRPIYTCFRPLYTWFRPIYTLLEFGTPGLVLASRSLTPDLHLLYRVYTLPRLQHAPFR